jgi:hypothetical protein
MLRRVASYGLYEVGYSIQGRRLLVFADSQARRGTIPLCFACSVLVRVPVLTFFFYFCASHIRTNAKLISQLHINYLIISFISYLRYTCKVGIASGAYICAKWEIMSQRYVLSLIDLMPKRMNSVVKAKGFWTSYSGDQFMKTALSRANILIPIWRK